MAFFFAGGAHNIFKPSNSIKTGKKVNTFYPSQLR